MTNETDMNKSQLNATRAAKRVATDDSTWVATRAATWDAMRDAMMDFSTS